MKTISYLKIICVIIVGLVVISCSSDDEYYQGIGTPPVDRRIVSYESYEAYSYSPKVDVSYDSRKRISTIEYFDKGYYYYFSFDYENMNIYKKIIYGGDEEYDSEIFHFNMNSQGYITKLFGGRGEKYGHDIGYEYIYEDGYMTKVYIYEDGDSCLIEEREYREGNLNKVAWDWEWHGSDDLNFIYIISYSNDDNVSNFNSCFFAEKGNSSTKKDIVNYLLDIPFSTAILSSVGLFGKNSVKLPKRISFYNGNNYYRSLDFNYVLDDSGYVQSVNSISQSVGYSPTFYATLDFCYKKY